MHVQEKKKGWKKTERIIIKHGGEDDNEDLEVDFELFLELSLLSLQLLEGSFAPIYYT